jgi:hypothetical protein
MKRFLWIVFAFLASTAAAQRAADQCGLGADERTVLEAVLRHFQVMDGSVEVRPFERALPAERYTPEAAAAVGDFNTRNAGPCPAADGPLTGLSLIVGPLKTRLSRVGFDAASATAFAEITMIGGPEIGSSHFVLLNRGGGGWKVIEDRLYRMF